MQRFRWFSSRKRGKVLSETIAANDAAPLVSYQLQIELTQAVSCTVGCLGLCHFPAGRDVYTGSARRNLEARIARHLAREKKLRSVRLRYASLR